MNGPFIVAQANTASTAQEVQKKPVKVVKVTKPSDGQAITVELSHDQPIKIDLTAIAGENVTLTRIGERLIILFDNRSTVTIEPYLDSMNVAFEVSPGRVVGAAEFLTLFSIATTDQTPGAPGSGADFSNTSVEPLGTSDRQESPGPLALLSQEFVPPNWNANFADPTLLRDAAFNLGGANSDTPVSEPAPPVSPAPPGIDNNPPFITAAVDSGTVTEGPLPVMIAVGAIRFGDVDLTDAHVAAVTPNGSGYLGNFAAVLTNESTGDGVGRVTWLFAANNALRQSLGVDQVLVQTYTVEIADGHGGIATQSVTITINGTNDAAVITGEATGTVVEAGGVNNGSPGTPTDIGDLNSTDVDDDPADSWEVISFPTASTNGYGTFTIDAAGVWTYTLDNNNTAVQALNVGQTLTDTFTVATVDGTEQVVSITIAGANDAAVITGPVTGTVVEAGGVANGGTPGIPAVTRDLLSTDVDNPSTWQPVAAGAATANGYGTFALDGAGVWTYTLDNSNPAVQALNVGQILSDTFTVFTVDGTSQLVTVTIAGRNDAAVIDGVANGSVTEAGGVNNGTPGAPTATGNLNSTDIDNSNDLWEPVNTPLRSQFGTYTLTAAGAWTYTLDNDNPAVQARNGGQTLTDTFAAFTVDGTQQLVTITINGANDAAVISGVTNGVVVEAGGVNNSNPGTPTATGDLSSSDLDNPNDVWTAVGTATMGANGFGTHTLTAAGLWTYTLDNSNATVQELNTGQTLTDTFTATTVGGTQQLVTITINGANDAAVISGDFTGTVLEAGGVANGTPGTPPATGDLNSTDIDNLNDAWTAVDTATASTKGYGTYTLTAAGLWTYTLDNSNADVQARNVGQILSDTFAAVTVDGDTQVVTITITGANDAAVISGATTGSVIEAGGVANGTPGTPTATGDLSSTDVDDPNDLWTAVNSPTVSGFGSYTLTAAGLWTYTLDNDNPTVQARNVGQTLTDTFTATTVDGTQQLVTITIDGTNDTTVISGVANGSVTEAGGVNNGTSGTPTATGDLNSTDIDNPSDAWQPVAAGAATAKGYGTFALDGAGLWTYTLDNSNPTVQARNVGQILIDTFTAVTVDGTSQVVTIIIRGRNDAAEISGLADGSVTEAGGVNNGTPGAPTATGNLGSTDVDDPNDAWTPVTATTGDNGYGSYTLTAAGAWTYTLDDDNPAVQALNDGDPPLTDTFTVRTVDGTQQLVTITIHGADDAAEISGVANGSVTEAGGVNNGTSATPTATGDLNSTDIDNPSDAWQPVAAGAATAKGYGTFALDGAGLWTYTLDNSNPTVQARNVGQILIDTFTAVTVDGTSQVVTIIINGANDAAVITDETTGTVVEAGGVNNGTPGTPTATGDLNSTDVDNPNDLWTAVNSPTVSGFGSYTLSAAGLWTYTLDNDNPTVQARNVGQTLTDTFTVRTVDGTQQLVTITIHGTDDAAEISGVANGSVTEAGGVNNGTSGTPTATGDLNSTDIDNPSDAWQPVAAGAATAKGYGTFALDGAGLWTYTLDNSNPTVQARNVGQILIDTFTAVTVDGTSQVVTIIINGANDAAVITDETTGTVVEAGGVNNGTPGTPTATGDLNSTDVDNPNDLWTAVNSPTVSGFGSYTLSAAGLWTYTLNNDNPTVQALNVGQTLTDTFTAATVDGKSQVVTVTINGADDAEVIGGDTSGSVTEAGGVNNGTSGTPIATGDVDNPTDSWQPVAAGAATNNGYGTFELDGTGLWTYTLDNSNPTVQARNVGQTLTDTFTVTTLDGTEQLVTITIHGTNDTAVIGGVASGSVTEAGGVDNGTPGILTATGDLNSTDVDNPNNLWEPVNTPLLSEFGTYTLTAEGAWTYTLNNDNPAVQARNVGQTLTDTFTAATVDGTAQLVTITIHGTNDTAVISGVANGSVTEAGGVANGTPGTPTAIGDLSSTDLDNPNDLWTAVNSPTVSGFGSYTLSAAGLWTYTLDNTNATVQSRNVGQTLTDTFTATTLDGTEQLVTITINGRNDTAVIGGVASGSVTEAGGVDNGTPGTPTATGNLNSTDVDNPNNLWEPVNTPLLSEFGTYTLTAEGAWTYTLNNDNPAVQARNVGQTLTDTFTAATVDGTAQLVTITIHGTNDTAVISGVANGSVTEAGGVANGTPGTPTAIGDLSSTDLDNPNDLWTAVNSPTVSGFGSYTLSAAGLWTYTLDNTNATVQSRNVGQTLTDTFTATTIDGTPQLVTIIIHGTNDAEVISGIASGSVTEAGGVNNGTPGAPTATGNLDSTDVDDPDDLWEPVNTPLRSEFGTYTLTAAGAWTYTLDNDNPAVQARNGGQTLTDTFAAFTVDGTQQLVTITINGANDTAEINGVASGSVVEAGGVANGTPGTPTATGDLSSSDLDNPNDVWTPVSTATASASGYGSYTLTAAGAWTYTLDNDNPTVQGRNVGQTLTDTFTVFTVDGTSQLVTVTIAGRNDAAVIDGVANGSVTEAGGVNNGTPGAPTATGNLNSTDIDNSNDLWEPVNTPLRSQFGTYTLTAAGAWTYTLDNDNPAVQARNGGQTLTDTFAAFTVDGTQQLVTITINGANDAAVISGVTNGVVVEAGGVNNSNPGTPTATGDLSSSDLDNPNDVWTAVGTATMGANGFGTHTLTAAGLWTYTLDNSNATVQELNTGQTLTDTFTATTVGGTQQLVTITINGANDAAVISGDFTGTVLEAGGVANGTPGTPPATGDLNSTDIDNLNDAWTAVDTATASTKGYGTYTLTAAGLWTYTLDNSNADVQARNVGQILSDTFAAVTVDGDTQVVTITITGANDAAVISGATTGSVIEAGGVANGTPGTPAATGDLNSTDVDDLNDDWRAVNSPTASSYGSYTLTAEGHWTYTLDNDNPTVQALNVGQTLTDTFTVATIDGTEQIVTITINGANDASNNPPTILGGDSAKYSISENTTDVFDVNATDPDGGTLTYSIVNTAETDFNKFAIDANTGVLAFVSAPSFESPNDVGGKDNDNKYVVDIQVSDGVLTDSQTIEVEVTNVTVNATDDIVRTGSPITVVPEWAFLYNDTSSAVGSILDITVTGSVSDLSDANLGIIPGSVTITNNDADGGSFVYTASDGIETETATVAVEIDAAPMAGDNDDEILVGTSAAETIEGGGGNNILIGGGGADTLIGGNGEDVLVYAAGVSFISGGSGGQVDLRAQDSRGDVLSVEGTVDFTSLDDVFEDIETISMLAKDGSNGNSAITLDIFDVLDLADSGIAAFASSGFDSKNATRIDGTSGDVVNLGPDQGTWLLATGATGVPDGYTAYSHVTSGSLANTNEDAYLFIQTGITVNGLGT